MTAYHRSDLVVPLSRNMPGTILYSWPLLVGANHALDA